MAKEKQDKVEERLSGRELRLKILNSQKENSVIMDENELRGNFRNYFNSIKNKHKLDSSIEEALWLHLKAINSFDSQDKFESGLKHFGIKL